MKSYTPYLKILGRVEKKIRPDLLTNHQILCKTADWMDCAVLKLQKKSWTQNGLGEGVFFSIWIGEKELKKERFNYNIHALKLRLWKGYRIKPVEFAAAFRSRLNHSPKRWPNLSLNYGPQTLMQGWVALKPETFETKVMKLISEFTATAGVIDEMITERKTGSS